MKTLDEMMEVLTGGGHITAANLEESALSSPVPGKADGVLVERFFLSGNQPSAVRRRPHAWLEVDMETGQLLRYVHCAVQDFAAALNVPLAGTLDYSAPAGGSYRELLRKKREFARLYGEIRGFAFSEAPDPGQREKVRQYVEMQNQVISPQALVYYQALSPEFFRWLDAVG